MAALCIKTARKLSCLPNDCRLYAIYATFKSNLKCKLARIQGGLCLFHCVLNNQNWLVFVCFDQFNVQLDVYHHNVISITTSTISEFKNDFDKT